MKNKGFTLIELLVVISIIGVLATIVVTSLGLSRERAREARFTAELNSFVTALELYNLDNGEYPDEYFRYSPQSTQYLTLYNSFMTDMEPYFDVRSFVESAPNSIQWFQYNPPTGSGGGSPHPKCDRSGLDYAIYFRTYVPSAGGSSGSYGDPEDLFVVDKYLYDQFSSFGSHCHTP